MLFVGVIAVVLAISTVVYAGTRAPGRGGIPAAIGGQTRPGTSVTGTCKTGKSDYVTNDTTGLSTTSTSYVTVPGMSRTFTIGGTAATCVIVDVSGFSFATGDALEYVTVLLDGSTFPSPTEVQFSGDDDENGNFEWARAHAANFVFPSVSPGSHTVTMAFKSLDGATVFLHRPAAIITHK